MTTFFSNPLECSTYGNPCAYNAQCINQKFGYKCICPTGMSGDPYKEGCILSRDQSVQCKNNNECADTLACVQGQCISPCKSLLCGQNAYCEPENHAAWCRCRVGFTENESGECVSRKIFIRQNQIFSIKKKLTKTIPFYLQNATITSAVKALFVS